MNVLLVDDSKAMRVLVRRALLQTGVRGLHVEEAENGCVALAKLALQQPDLILSDWSMPEMTGIELLRELRARGCEVKFGFITCEAASAQAPADTGEALPDPAGRGVQLGDTGFALGGYLTGESGKSD